MSQALLGVIAIPIAAILLLFTLRRIIFTLAILPEQDKKSSALGNEHLPEVLLLIPCRDEAGMIPDLCQALSRLDYPPECFQVVLIDDGSTDGTGLLMEQQAASRSGWHVLKFSNTVVSPAVLETGAVCSRDHVNVPFVQQGRTQRVGTAA